MDAQLKLGAAAIVAVLAAGAVVACGNDPTAPRTTTYVAQMSGANEVPAVAGGATGTATFTLNGKTLSYVVTVNGLSGNAAASHIHFGGAGTNGNIAYPFAAAAVQSGQVASGSIDLTQPVSNGSASISGDSLLALLNAGQVYTNVHTAANPGGEIRGQITRATPSMGY
jgi:CHRD domain-containing protein